MVTHSLAVGHVREGDAPAAVAPKWEMSRAAGPAGATINTTIDDLLAFAQMHLRGGARRRRDPRAQRGVDAGDAAAAGVVPRAGAAR